VPWPPPEILPLAGGTRLRFTGERILIGEQANGQSNLAHLYTGPHGLAVLISLDHRRGWDPLLHASLSLPRGYPTWELIFSVARAVFGPDLDCMMPIPREAAFIHGATALQRKGHIRQVFHLVQMPRDWPSEA